MSSFKNLDNLIATLCQRGKRSIILVRHGQTDQNKLNQISGWSDDKLNLNGREQAQSLYQSLQNNIPQFKAIYSSDLIRVKETCHIALGCPEENIYQFDQRLREIYFGLHENINYNTFSKEQKQYFESMDYVAPEGESWHQVKNRALEFFKDKCIENGTYLIFTHGGLIRSVSNELGYQNALSNCSSIGIELDQDNSHPLSIQYIWHYPKPQQNQKL